MPKENYRIDYILVREMAKAFSEETFDCLKAEGLVNTSVGPTQEAHRLILNDHLWRLQDKIGKLWMYVSGSGDFETILREQFNREKDEMDRKAIEEKEAARKKMEEVTEKVEEITLTESSASSELQPLA